MKPGKVRTGGNASKARLSRRLNLELLAHFEILMRERHVSRAASAMGIGQPAMSSALSRLREVFQDPLLIRTPSGMVPTERALQLERRVHQMMEMVDTVFAPTQDIVDPRTIEASISISAPDSIALFFMPTLMSYLRRHAPGLQIIVWPEDNRRLRELLEDGVCDIAINFIKEPPQMLRSAKLYPQRVSCIVSRDHPEIRRNLTLDAYVRYPHVLWGMEPVPFPAIELMVDEALDRRGLSRTAGIRVGNGMLAPAIVAATDMIATVSDRVAHASAALLPLNVMRPPIELDGADISMYWHERTHLDPVRSFLRRKLRDTAKALRQARPVVAEEDRAPRNECI